MMTLADSHRGRHRPGNQAVVQGCGFLLLLAIVSMAGLYFFLINELRQTTHYPGATLISNRSFYTPRFTFWHQEYATSDSPTKIGRWYQAASGLQVVANPPLFIGQECQLWHRLDRQFVLEHELGVMICHGPRGRQIFVTRSLVLR
jgi:hypothetical protein